MYIENGVAHAGELVKGIKVASAVVVNRLSMLVTFSTGETRLFDASQLLAYPAFEPIADQGTFESFSIEHGVVSWEAGENDTAPERMYAISFPYEKAA